MTEAEINFWIAIAALVIAIAAATFSGIQAWYAYQASKRKKLIFEVTENSIEGQPEWTFLQITVRNLEAVSAQINSVRTKRKARLISKETAHKADGMGGQILKNNLPIDLCRSSIVSQTNIGSSTSNSDHAGWNGPEVRLEIYAYRWNPSNSLTFDWKWRDE